MFFELYLDVLFLVNLCINYLLLRSVTVLMKAQTGRIRSLTGSAIGAFGVCIFVCLPVRITSANLLPVHVVTSTLMVKIGCKIKNVKDLCIGVAALYFAGCLWGGMFFVVYQSQDHSRLSVILFFSVLFYEVMVIGIEKYRCNKRNRDRYCDVTLYVKEKSKKVKGLYDTGNLLFDPMNGSPVSVADKMVIDELIGSLPETMEDMKPHYIPYRTVGTEHGVMLALVIDRMDIVMNEKHFHIERPVLALAKESVSFTQHYQLILNPNLVDS